MRTKSVEVPDVGTVELAATENGGYLPRVTAATDIVVLESDYIGPSTPWFMPGRAYSPGSAVGRAGPRFEDLTLDIAPLARMNQHTGTIDLRRLVFPEHILLAREMIWIRINGHTPENHQLVDAKVGLRHQSIIDTHKMLMLCTVEMIEGRAPRRLEDWRTSQVTALLDRAASTYKNTRWVQPFFQQLVNWRSRLTGVTRSAPYLSRHHLQTLKESRRPQRDTKVGPLPVEQAAPIMRVLLDYVHKYAGSIIKARREVRSYDDLPLFGFDTDSRNNQITAWLADSTTRIPTYRRPSPNRSASDVFPELDTVAIALELGFRSPGFERHKLADVPQFVSAWDEGRTTSGFFVATSEDGSQWRPRMCSRTVSDEVKNLQVACAMLVEILLGQRISETRSVPTQDPVGEWVGLPVILGRVMKWRGEWDGVPEKWFANDDALRAIAVAQQVVEEGQDYLFGSESALGARPQLSYRNFLQRINDAPWHDLTIPGDLESISTHSLRTTNAVVAGRLPGFTLYEHKQLKQQSVRTAYSYGVRQDTKNPYVRAAAEEEARRTVRQLHDFFTEVALDPDRLSGAGSFLLKEELRDATTTDFNGTVVVDEDALLGLVTRYAGTFTFGSVNHCKGDPVHAKCTSSPLEKGTPFVPRLDACEVTCLNWHADEQTHLPEYERQLAQVDRWMSNTPPELAGRPNPAYTRLAKDRQRIVASIDAMRGADG